MSFRAVDYRILVRNGTRAEVPPPEGPRPSGAGSSWLAPERLGHGRQHGIQTTADRVCLRVPAAPPDRIPDGQPERALAGGAGQNGRCRRRHAALVLDGAGRAPAGLRDVQHPESGVARG